MGRLRTWTPLGLGGLSSGVAAVVGVAAPRRARCLAAEYARFRAGFQATHDAIDAGYDHHDWDVQLEWVTGAGHFDNFDRPAQVAEAINRFVRAAERSGLSR